MPNKVTIEDVARSIGCSITAVSRALNDKYGVSDEKRNRIRLEALSMGYVRPASRHPEKKKKSAGLCLSMVVTHSDLLDENFHRKIVYGIESELNGRGVSSFLTTIESIDGEEQPINLRRIKADGILIIGQLSLPNVAAILSSGIPVVMADTLYLDFKMNRVTMNNFQGGYEATDYLIAHGHRELIFAGDPAYSFGFAERYRGFVTCAQRHDLPTARLHPVTTRAEGGRLLPDREELRRLLLGPRRPTAVMCANDAIAFAVYDLCREWGLRIPEDVSVIGFDNSEQSGRMSPPLTSVDVPKFEIGRTAARLLLERMNDPDLPTRLIELDIGIEERGSVGSVSQ